VSSSLDDLRIENLKRAIEDLKLGSTRKTRESKIESQVIDAINEYQTKRPPEYEAEYIKFIELVRDRVWKRSEQEQRAYFDAAQDRLWELALTKSPSEAREQLLIEFDPDTYSTH
jgi:hypothetical protein